MNLLKNISYREIWSISYPIILGGVAQNIVNVTDTAFLGKFGEIPLAAAGNGGIFYMVIIMAGMGFTAGGEILIGRRNGENNAKEIGKIFSHLVYCLLALSVIFFLISKFSIPHLINAVSKSKEIAQYTIEYLDYRIWGVFFSFLCFAFRAFFVGITETKILITNTAIMGIVNVILDYALIFGELGMPMMGVAGAAIASVIAEVIAFIHFFWYTSRIDHKKYHLFKFTRIKTNIVNQISKVATPIMVRNFISLTSWLIFFLIIEQIGERELAVSHIARSFYMVLIIPLWGFSA
ncbi:MAG: MATE family efflux transporter, partial [Flavobacteriales bacterium]|nr:MATE family efflux transporter [Flavobacteriales bacterium]